jgi:predicted ATP-binding protein involved in virulence
LLKRLTISNLGCFDEQQYRIDFSEETLIAGPNNSGKSLFLTGINIIRQILIGSFSWQNNLYSLTAFADSVHNHETDRSISISLVTSDSVGRSEHTISCNIKNNSAITVSIDGVPYLSQGGGLLSMQGIIPPQRRPPVSPQGPIPQPVLS